MPTPDALALSQVHPLSQASTGAPIVNGRLSLRLALAGVAFAVEVCIVAALGHPWILTHQIGTAPIAFLAALLFFGRRQLVAVRESAAVALRSGAMKSRRSSVGFFSLHAVAFFGMLLLDGALHESFARSGAVRPATFAAWCVALVVMLVSLVVAAVAPRTLLMAARKLGFAWAYATACAVLAVFFRALEYLAWDAPSSWLGNHLASGSFSGVHLLLGLFYTNILADPAARVMGTPQFRIHVAGTCSGVEGLGLVLVLTTGWILYERKQLRIGRAMLLTPIALCVMWLLNIVRIAALVAIGLGGHPTLAVTGFHTEAGWIAFTLVAIGFLLAASHIRWFHKDGMLYAETAPSFASVQSNLEQPVVSDNTVVAYVLPFVAILTTSLFTRALSTTGFEELYSARLFIAGAVFFVFRKLYAQIKWRARPLDFAAGAVLGLVWIFLARHSDGSVIANGLAGMSVPGRIYWLTTRALTAVLVVPFMEELAFRGFLARRIVAEHFEAVRYARMTITSMVFSSMAFGAMHGELWIIGSVAGLLFAWLARRSNSIGSAVAAHATANFMLAVMVLAHRSYGLW